MPKFMRGKSFLENYANGLLTEDAKLMASLFHKGLAYIVNNEAREGADALCEVSTWEFIFSRVRFLAVDISEFKEVCQGHIFYKEVLSVQSKVSLETNQGVFEDETVINAQGEMLLVNRVAETAYFDWFNKALA